MRLGVKVGGSVAVRNGDGSEQGIGMGRVRMHTIVAHATMAPEATERVQPITAASCGEMVRKKGSSS